MHGLYYRAFALTGLFLLSGFVLRATDSPAPISIARWPTEDMVFQVEGWQFDPAQTETINGVQFVTRAYHHAAGNGSAATLVLSTSPEAKRIYRAGPEVPFLGNGFSVQPLAAVGQFSPIRYGAFVGTRGDEGWLQLSTYGERRGSLGNGPLAWGLTVFDAALGQSNDYYLIRLLVPTPASGVDGQVVQSAESLADALFARLTAWYAA
jgi:hypothetical protein